MTADLLTLPGTDLQVSRLCLGGNRLGGALDRDASFRLLDAFVARGGTFIDTAHIYADWLPDVERSCSEKTLGRWLKARGGLLGVVIATKIGHPRLDEPATPRLDPVSLRQDVEDGLSYLGLPAIDLVYLHRDDPRRPVEEILGTLEDLRRDRLIRHYGASNWATARMEEAQAVAGRRGWAGFVANQSEWSLAERTPGSTASDLLAMDAGMLDFHRRTGLAAVPYSSQAKGYFDKVLAGPLDPATAKTFDNEPNRARAARLGDVARRHGATPTEVALHVLTRTPFPTIPVVGCRTEAQLASSFRSLDLALSEAELAELLPIPSGGL